MKGIMFGIVFVVLAAAAFALDGTTGQVHIYGPLDAAVMKSLTQDFVFSIEAPESGKACTISVDDKPVKSYADIERRATAKFTLALPDGFHTWSIACTLVDGTAISSDTRNITVDTSSYSTSCVADIYKGQGSYRYAFTGGCINSGPVVLPNLRPNDWIEYWLDVKEKAVPKKADGTIFTIYLTKLSTKNDADYIQFFTSKDKERVDVFANETAELDTNGDGTKEVTFTLNSVARKKARATINFIGKPIGPTTETNPGTTGTTGPGTNTTPETATAPGTAPGTADETGTSTGTADESTVTEPTSEGTPGTDIKEPVGEDVVKDDPTKLYVTLIIIGILAIIVAYLFLSQRKGKKKDEKPKEAEDEEETWRDRQVRKEARDEARGKRQGHDFMIEGKRKK